MNSTIVKNKLMEDYHIDVIKIYKYGSRVYGTNTKDSDYDFIAISNTVPVEQSYSWGNIDVTVYSKDEFQTKLNNHDISALECMWINGIDPIFTFNINKETLRESISAKVSHCWVKGKKKLTVGSVPPKADDKYIGLKSIFHAFRICDYGIQIAEFGKIVEYDRSNYIWNALKNFSNDSWDTISSAYKVELNNKMSTFRQFCPKIV